MALTYNYDFSDRCTHGNYIGVFSSVFCDSSYPTGGYSFNPEKIILSSIKSLTFERNSGLPNYLAIYDYSAGKVKIIDEGSSASNTGGSVIELESPGGGDIKGSVNTDSENADAAALPTNGNLVATETAVGAGAWTVGTITSPDVRRNVAIVIHNDSGGALNLFEGVMTFTITGLVDGASTTNTIIFTSSAGNKAVADTKYRYKYGTKPFDTITNVTLDNVPDNGLKIGVGIGSKIGILKPLYTPAVADVIKLTKNGANLDPTGLVDFASATRGVNFGTLANGDDVAIEYKTRSFTGGTEVPSGTNLSDLLLRFHAVGSM